MNLTSIRPSDQRAHAAVQSQIANFKSPMPPPAPPLTRAELTQLSDCEEVIKRGLHTFIEVGLALEVVRAKKLYREKFGTFEEYCRVRWDMTARRARQICSASEVVTNLLGASDPPPGLGLRQSSGAFPGTIVPTTESQARPLTTLSPPAQRKVWAAAVAAAPEGKVTAAIVQEQVDAREKALRKRRTRNQPEAPKPETETLHTCPICGQGGFLADGLKRHQGSPTCTRRAAMQQPCNRSFSPRGPIEAKADVANLPKEICKSAISARGDSTAALATALGGPAKNRLAGILAAVERSTSWVKAIQALLDTADTQAQAECRLALTHLDNLERKFLRRK